MRIVSRQGGDRPVMETLTLLASRRRAAGELGAGQPAAGAGQSGAAHPADGEMPWCLYPDSATVRGDDTVIRPLEPKATSGAPVSYVAWPTAQKLLVSRQNVPDGVPWPALVTISRQDDRLTVTSDRTVGSAVLIDGGQFYPIAALAARAAKPLAPADAQPLRRLLADPAAYGFDPAAARLLAWWDLLERGQASYLICPATPKDQPPQLSVSAAVPLPPP